jgi:hypothetical protein
MGGYFQSNLLLTEYSYMYKLHHSFYLVTLGFELRASNLLGRHLTT